MEAHWRWPTSRGDLISPGQEPAMPVPRVCLLCSRGAFGAVLVPPGATAGLFGCPLH